MPEFDITIRYVYNKTEYEYNRRVTAGSSDDAFTQVAQEAIVVDKPEQLEVWVVPVGTPVAKWD